MHVFLNFIIFLSAALWIGEIFFFAAVLGPAIFGTLEREMAGNVVSAVFPKYYVLGTIAGAAMLISSAVMWISSYEPLWLHPARTALVVVMLGLWVYTGFVLRAETHVVRTELRALSEDDPAHVDVSKKFGSLHKRSVMINGAVLILGIAFIFLSGYNYRE